MSTATKSPAFAPRGHTLDERQLYLDVMRERMQATARSLDRGLERAAGLEDDARRRLHDRLESLRHKRDSLEAKLGIASRAATDTFDAVRVEIDEAWRDLKTQWASAERALGDAPS